MARNQMRTTRRQALTGLALLPFAVRAADEPLPKETNKKVLMDSWFVTSDEVSIMFSLLPTGGALVMFVDRGSVSIGRHLWRPLPGGVLIDSVPRFRMWEASGSCEARVEMEVLPAEVEVSGGLKSFPLKFCMRRVTHAPIPKELLERALPKGWESATREE